MEAFLRIRTRYPYLYGAVRQRTDNHCTAMWEDAPDPFGELPRHVLDRSPGRWSAG